MESGGARAQTTGRPDLSLCLRVPGQRVFERNWAVGFQCERGRQSERNKCCACERTVKCMVGLPSGSLHYST